MEHKHTKKKVEIHPKTNHETKHETKHKTNPLLIIFDIDGTLAGDSKTNRIRTGQAAMFRQLQEHGYTLALWTGASVERLTWFIKCVSTNSPPFLFTWCGDRCVKRCVKRAHFDSGLDRYHSSALRKPLWKVWRRFKKQGFNRRNTIIVDNTPSTFALNYGNGLHVPSFQGWESNDVILQMLCEKLKQVQEHFRKTGDVRGMSKCMETNCQQCL
jgi:hypothetical protein